MFLGLKRTGLPITGCAGDPAGPAARDLNAGEATWAGGTGEWGSSQVKK